MAYQTLADLFAGYKTSLTETVGKFCEGFRSVIMLGFISFLLVPLVTSTPVLHDINAAGCGSASARGATPFIVGGVEAMDHEYPWMAALYNRGSFFCGGSLIQGANGDSYVLTAAHCTAGKRSQDLEVRLGRHDLALSESDTRQHIGVESIHDNPSYDSSSISWDFSLLKLATNAAETASVHFGCVTISDKSPQENSTVIGWGSTSEGGSLPSQLRKVWKPVLEHETCRTQLGANNYEDTNMICAGFDAGGSDACQGDSGGPLMAYRTNGRLEIIGVVSWGFGCARPERPGVYGNVFMAKSWIEGIIG